MEHLKLAIRHDIPNARSVSGEHRLTVAIHG
jgi:hypothetical protein